MIRSVPRYALLLALLGAVPGCLALAAGAGVGAAGAVAWTQRGASSTVQGTVDRVFERSVAVFGEMGITRTGESTADGGRERRLVGTQGDLEVTVEIERESDATSRVEVYARRNPVEWERSYARDVLGRIVDRS